MENSWALPITSRYRLKMHNIGLGLHTVCSQGNSVETQRRRCPQGERFRLCSLGCKDSTVLNWGQCSAWVIGFGEGLCSLDQWLSIDSESYRQTWCLQRKAEWQFDFLHNSILI